MKVIFPIILASMVLGAFSPTAQASSCKNEINRLEKMVNKTDEGTNVTGDRIKPQSGAGDVPGAGKPGVIDTNGAQSSLSRAKAYQKAGKEAECQAEVNKAKAAFGLGSTSF
ncbi:MAG: hypothetical protein ABWY00_01570 [Dongiaceae bacterium]